MEYTYITYITQTFTNPIPENPLRTFRFAGGASVSFPSFHRPLNKLPKPAGGVGHPAPSAKKTGSRISGHFDPAPRGGALRIYRVSDP